MRKGSFWVESMLAWKTYEQESNLPSEIYYDYAVKTLLIIYPDRSMLVYIYLSWNELSITGDVNAS